jgi:hypothetical protein
MALRHSCVYNDETTEPPAHNRLVLATITSVMVAIFIVRHCRTGFFLIASILRGETGDILRGADADRVCAQSRRGQGQPQAASKRSP